MDKRPVDVICMGRVAVDLYAEDIGKPLAEASGFRKYLGGCAGNIAVGAARLGLQSAMFSRVGQDAMGEFLRHTLRQEGVDTRLLSDTPDHLTGLVLLGIQPPRDFPLLFYRNDCADMQLKASMMDPSVLQQAKALLITGTGLSTAGMRETTGAVVRMAKNCGTQVILDIDYRPVLWGLGKKGDGENRFAGSQTVTGALQAILGECDVIVGTEEEWCIAGGSTDLQAALREVRKRTAALLVVKRGEQGAMAYPGALEDGVFAKPFAVDVLNVLGAGDAFMAGFLRGYLRAEPLEQSLIRANACGALVVTRHGCSVACPWWDELSYFLAMTPPDWRSPELQKRHAPAKALTGAEGMRLSAPGGFTRGLQQICRTGGADDFMQFSVVRLHPGESFAFDETLEFAALLMSGRVTFQVNGVETDALRSDYFNEAPIVLHAPRDTRARVIAHTLAEILLTETPNPRVFEPILFDAGNMLERDERGKGLLEDTASRLVRTVFDKRNRPESNLVIGEIVTFQGRWSSFPPHSHPQAEIYHYRFSEPDGFAFGEQGESVLRIRHNDTCAIRGGDVHAHTTAPGYALWTCWVIRHHDNAPYRVPDFAKVWNWTREEAANLRAWRPLLAIGEE